MHYLVHSTQVKAAGRWYPTKAEAIAAFERACKRKGIAPPLNYPPASSGDTITRGDGLKWAIDAGVDDIQHAVAATDEDIQMFLRKDLPITCTILDLRQDEPGDLKQWAPYSRFRLMEQTWKKMLKSGVKLGFGSGATPVSNGQGRIFNTSCKCSHGVQSEMFPIFVSWGATPLYTLRMATVVNAAIIHWQDRIGTIEKGKFADLIATSGDPLQDISEMQRVKFVMKGGSVIKDELTGSHGD